MLALVGGCVCVSAERARAECFAARGVVVGGVGRGGLVSLSSGCGAALSGLRARGCWRPLALCCGCGAWGVCTCCAAVLLSRVWVLAGLSGSLFCIVDAYISALFPCVDLEICLEI